MILESRYNIGDKVWRITYNEKNIPIECPACRGLAKVLYPDGQERNCVECYGRGLRNFKTECKWFVESKSLTIGMIRIIQDGRSKRVEYMCLETGINSGSVYKEEYLFLAKQEAIDLCKELNNKKK